MSDTDLIYKALERAERRVEETADEYRSNGLNVPLHVRSIGATIELIREEIGRGLAEKDPAP